MTGTLTIVGLGPGDPELVTVKAARLLGAARTIVFFAKRGAAGHARTIADRYLAEGVEEIRLDYPFTTEIAVADPAYRCGIDDFHDGAATGLAARLAGGAELLLLCEGDPFFYGSAMHLADRMSARGHRVRVVPGVTAMSAAWSEAAIPIAHGDDVTTVLPATLPPDMLASRLRETDAAVIMKLGRNLPKVHAALREAGLLDRALYVERATQSAQVIEKLTDRDPYAPAPYFSLVLLPGRRRGPR